MAGTRSLVRLTILGIALSGLLGCDVPRPASLASSTLSAEDEEFLQLIVFMTRVAGVDGDAVASARTAQGLKVQGAVPSTAETTGGFYTGPFPTEAEQLPSGYAARQTGDWLKTNPLVQETGTTTTTETYWTPDGTKAPSFAYTRLVRTGGTTTYDLYASPQETGAGLPAFFREKLGFGDMPLTVYTSQETYKAIEPGKSALGYRWAAHDADGLKAWVRAHRILPQTGAPVAKYEIFSNYQPVNGVRRPTRYQYGFLNETTRIGGELDEHLDFNACRASAHGAWVDLANKKRVNYFQTLFPSGELRKEMTYTPNPSLTIRTIEIYQPNGSGAGEVLRNGARWAGTEWGTNGLGTLNVSGTSAAYSASRRGQLMPTPLCSRTIDTGNANLSISFVDANIPVAYGPPASTSLNVSF